MDSSSIKTLDELKEFLYRAMQLEHATIPPYLTALYSIKPGVNQDATQVLRVIVVEEMLHLTIAANILNAIGGTPDLVRPDFVARYPAALPDGETDFKVSIQAFGREALATFLKIERPAQRPEHLVGKGLIHRKTPLISPRLPAIRGMRTSISSVSASSTRPSRKASNTWRPKRMGRAQPSLPATGRARSPRNIITPAAASCFP